MPTAVENAAAQIVTLRARVGQGTSTEILGDAEATTCLNSALRELNRMLPKWDLLSFLTVADQQRYTETAANVPADAYRPIRKVFWRNGVEGGDCQLFVDAGDPYAFVVESVFKNEYPLRVDAAALEIAARNYSVIQRYVGGRGWQEKDDMIYLDPIPQSSNIRVYYFCLRPRFAAIGDVDTQRYEAYMAAAEMYAYRLLAGKQSEAVAVSGGAFGKRISTAGGAVYLKLAEECERRFYSMTSRYSKIYHV